MSRPKNILFIEVDPCGDDVLFNYIVFRGGFWKDIQVIDSGKRILKGTTEELVELISTQVEYQSRIHNAKLFPPTISLVKDMATEYDTKTYILSLLRVIHF